MSMSFANVYTHRKVAESSGKACDICYKITTSVLITENKEDFFYVCASHLKDLNFAAPDKDALKAMQDAETKKVVEEWEARRKKREQEKAEKEKEKEKEGEKTDDKGKEKTADEDKPSAEKDKDNDKDKDDPDEDPSTAEFEPRIFNLRPAFFNRRLEKKRQAEQAKRTRELMQQPNLFPSVPKDPPRR